MSIEHIIKRYTNVLFTLLYLLTYILALFTGAGRHYPWTRPVDTAREHG